MKLYWKLATVALGAAVASGALAGQIPYKALVVDDDAADFNEFYISPKVQQFVITDWNLNTEGFASNGIPGGTDPCDLVGDQGNQTFLAPAGLSTKYEWNIEMPGVPMSGINIDIQCAVLKPNTTDITLCAAETGEDGPTLGICHRRNLRKNRPTLRAGTLPRLGAYVTAGPLNPKYDSGSPPYFYLTAFKNPSDYFFELDGEQLYNGSSMQLLDKSKYSRIVLKSCLTKTIYVKMPVQGQKNAKGQKEFDVRPGDLVTVELKVPGNSLVDIYCHAESVELSGIANPLTLPPTDGEGGGGTGTEAGRGG